MKQTTRKPLDGEAEMYLINLISEYQVLEPTVADSAAKRVADGLLERWMAGDLSHPFSLRDLASLEAALIAPNPEERLRREAVDIRSRLGALAGKDAYESYLRSGPPDPKTAPVADLRADLQFCLRETHRAQSRVVAEKQIRASLITRATLATLVLCGVAALADVSFLHSRSPANFDVMLAFAALFGALGGFVSLMHRLQKTAAESDAAVISVQLRAAQGSAVLSPVLGAVFAILLTLAFTADLIEGTLFPNMGLPGGEKATAQAFTLSTLTGTMPQTVADFGKLLVWAFIAGFAERLVPDSLDRLASKVSTESTNIVTITREPGAAVDRPAPADQDASGDGANAQKAALSVAPPPPSEAWVTSPQGVRNGDAPVGSAVP